MRLELHNTCKADAFPCGFAGGQHGGWAIWGAKQSGEYNSDILATFEFDIVVWSAGWREEGEDFFHCPASGVQVSAGVCISCCLHLCISASSEILRGLRVHISFAAARYWGRDTERFAS
jgi:hypothetical protein